MKKLILSFIILFIASFNISAQVSFDGIDTLSYLGTVNKYAYVDFNDDNYLDILYTIDERLYLKENIDGINFKEGVQILSTTSNVIDIPELVDFNDDGVEDLVLVTSDSLHTYYRNENTYNLKESFFRSSMYKFNVQLLDFNNDEAIDLIFEEEGKIKLISDYSNASVEDSVIVMDYELPGIMDF